VKNKMLTINPAIMPNEKIMTSAMTPMICASAHDEELSCDWLWFVFIDFAVVDWFAFRFG
jgi:hypothetical protein